MNCNANANFSVPNKPSYDQDKILIKGPQHQKQTPHIILDIFIYSDLPTYLV